MKNYLLTLLSILSLVYSTSAVPTWVPRASKPVTGSYEAATFAINDDIYIVAGNPSSAGNTNAVWAYNSNSDSWTQKSNYNGGAVVGARAFVLNQNGYVVSGQLNGGSYVSTMNRYDPLLNSWTSVATFPGSARYTGVAIEIAGKGYFGTGYQPLVSDWWEYDPATNAWSQKANVPGSPRQSAIGFTLGSKGYVGLGSFTQHPSYTPLNDFYEFNPQTNLWIPKASFPLSGRWSCMTFSFGGEGYIGGGTSYSNASGPYTFYDDFYKYNASTDSWTFVNNIPGSRYGGAAGVVNNRIFAGLGYSGTAYLNSWYELVGLACNLNVNLIPVHPTCSGDCDGSISINITNGNGSYSYLWSNGATTSGVSSLCDGVYSVIVTDLVSQCSDTAAITLSKPPVGGVVVETNTSGCGTCDGSISASGNGGNGSPYTYLWNNGATTGIISNLCAGNYTVVITDVSGCSFSSTKSVAGSAAVTIAETIVHDTSCTLGQCSGSIAIVPNPGSTSGYTFQWNNGASGAINSSLCPGAYTVTVTGSNGCTAIESYIVLDSSDCNPSPCNLGLTISKVNPICYGDCNGSMTANVTNGSGNYMYSWSNGAIGSSIQNLCAGTYTVIVTDANTLCTATLSQSIIKGKVGANVTRIKATCGLCNGSILLSGNGGNGAPYTYLWSNGATTGNIDSLCPGVYTATITDKSGCTFICTSTILNDTTGCNSTCENDFTTYTQGGWGNPGAPGQYMAANFASCFSGGVSIGDPCGYKITLTTVQEVRDFLPQGGTPAVLSQSYTNPGSGNISVLAGQLLSVHFALAFDACDSNLSASSSPLGNQVYIGSLSTFYGWNIQAIHDTAMRVFAGCSSNFTPAAINNILTQINENYDNGGNKGKFVCPDDFSNITIPDIAKFKVFPNPFNRSFVVDTKGETGLKVVVSDLTGKILYSYDNVSSEVLVNGDFGYGIYLITVINPISGTQQVVRAISIP